MNAVTYTPSGPGIQELINRVANPGALAKILGRRGANELKAHFLKRDAEPNKLGGPKQHFWQAVADSVSNPVVESENQVRITIADPRFAIKVYGGTIVPRAKEALTIPVDPESYGRTVSTFEHETGIVLFRLKKSGGVLTNLLMGVVGDHEVKVFYVLSDHSDQDPDPHALPDQEQFEGALYDEADQWVARQTAD